MRFVSPEAGHQFVIRSDGTLRPVSFTTDARGEHRWQWTLSWRTFRKTGTLSTNGGTVDLALPLAELGGRLTVTARNGAQTATIATTIIGTNPTDAELRTYVNGRPNGADFLPIVEHEAHGRHFNARGEPIVSFDGGYGMVQLTDPIPTYEQVWSWKRNIDAGLALFAVKRTEAIRFLGQGGRSYTAAQLRLEAVARWNGGAYHRWDGRAWARNPDMLCAPGTGNIGWDMTDPDNAGQTAQQLLVRDRARFNRPPRRGIDHYRYSGICYADRLVR